MDRDWTVPPGETLLEALEERDMTQAYLAWATGFTPKHINRVIKGAAPISPKLALALEAELSISAEFWVRAQALYDLDLARGRKVFGS